MKRTFYRASESAARAILFGFLLSPSCTRPPLNHPAVDAQATAQKPPESNALIAASPIGGAQEVTPELPVLARPLFSDLRLSSTALSMDKKDYRTAVASLREALTREIFTERERLILQFQLGKLLKSAGDEAAAANAFLELATHDSELRDYSRYQAALSTKALGRPKDALALAKAVDLVTFADRDAVHLLIADLSVALRDIKTASDHYHRYLEFRDPSANRSTFLRAGQALLRSENADDLRFSLKLAERVLYETRNGYKDSDATSLQKAARAALKNVKNAPPHPGVGTDERLRRARLLIAASNFEGALSELSFIASGALKGQSECEAVTLRAQAEQKSKKYAQALKSAVTATKICGRESAAKALVIAGNTALQLDRDDEAVDFLSRAANSAQSETEGVEARLLLAKILVDGGKDDEAEEVLAEIARRYPDSSAAAEADFELGLIRLGAQEYSQALGPLSRALERSVRFKDDEDPYERGAGLSRVYHRAGRELYYVGRSLLGAGDTQGAVEKWTQLIGDYPLSYYMTLAYARLSEIDRNYAKSALSTYGARDHEDFKIAHSSLEAIPTYRAGLDFAALSDLNAADRAFEQVAVDHPEVAREARWARALVFAQAGDLVHAHWILRRATLGANSSAPKDWLAYYPLGSWRGAWQVAYPRLYAELVQQEAQKNDVPQALIFAIMREESGFEPQVMSPAKAIGLMQLIVPTAKTMAKPLGISVSRDSLKVPATNIALGARYLATLRDKFKPNVLLAIPGYNAGGGAPERWVRARPNADFDLWVERIPYSETRLYTKRVIASMAAYEFLYGASSDGEAFRAPLSVAPRKAAGEGATVAQGLR